MGRRKIDIEPITNERNRTVTFIKRKAGLFKKAHELAVLCNVDIAVIILGTNKQFYEYSSVETPQLINTYQRKDLQHHVKDPCDYGDGFVKKKFIDVQLSPGKFKNRKPKKKVGQEAIQEHTDHIDVEAREEDEEGPEDEKEGEGEEGEEEEEEEEGEEEEKEEGEEVEEYTLDQLGKIDSKMGNTKKLTKRQATMLQDQVSSNTNKKRKLSNPVSQGKNPRKSTKNSGGSTNNSADEQETVLKTKSNIKSSNKTQNKKQLRIKTGEKKLDSKMVQQFQQMYSTTLSKSNDTTPNQQRHTVPPVSAVPSFPTNTAHQNPAYLGSQTITVPAYHQQGQHQYQSLSGYSGKPFLYPGSATANTATSLRTGSLNVNNTETDVSKPNLFAPNANNTLVSRLDSSSFLANTGMLRGNRTPTTPALLIGGDNLMARPFGKGNLLTPKNTTFNTSNDVTTGVNEDIKNSRKLTASKLKDQNNLYPSSRPQLRVEIPNTGRDLQSSDSSTTENIGVSGSIAESNANLDESTTENANVSGNHVADANAGGTNRPYPGMNYGISVHANSHKTPVSSALPSPLLFDSATKLPNVSSIPFSSKQPSFNPAATRVRGNNFFNMSVQNGNNNGNSAFPSSAANSNIPTNYMPQSAMISPSFQQYFATPLVGPGAYANANGAQLNANISNKNTDTNINNTTTDPHSANSADEIIKEKKMGKQVHTKKPSLTVNTSSTSLESTSYSNSENQPLSATTKTLIGDQSFPERPNIKTGNTKNGSSFQHNKNFDSANPYAFKPHLPHINTAMDASSNTAPTSVGNPDTVNVDQNGAGLNANGGGLSAVFSPMNYLFQDWGQPPSALPSNTGFPTAQPNTLSGLLHNNRNNGQASIASANAANVSHNDYPTLSTANMNNTHVEKPNASGAHPDKKTSTAGDFVLSKDAPTTDKDKENKQE